MQLRKQKPGLLTHYTDHRGAFCWGAKLVSWSLLETNSLTLLSNTPLSKRTLRWHLRHLRPMPAPTLTTSHSSLPQGCGLRSRTVSPGFTSMVIDLLADFFSYVSSRLGEILFPGGIKNLSGYVDNRLLAPGIRSVANC